MEEDALQDNQRVEAALHEYLEESRVEKLDSIVLGCTHFIFYKKKLQELVPEHVEVIDGNQGTVSHLKDILTEKNLLNKSGGTIEWKNTLEDKIGLSKKLFEKLEEQK